MALRAYGHEELWVDCDNRGNIMLYHDAAGKDVLLVISAVQSENLRRLLQMAEQIVESGVGTMSPQESY